MKKTTRTSIVRLVGALAGLFTLFWVFKDVDAGMATDMLVRHIRILPLLLCVYAAATVIDTLAWRMLFNGGGHQISFLALWRVHVIGEAFVRSIPLGALVADGMKPLLLRRLQGVSVADSVTSLTMRKSALGLSQGGYILFSASCGVVFLHRISMNGLGWSGLGWFVISGAIVMMLGFYGATLFFTNGSVARSLSGWIDRLPVQSLRTWMHRQTAVVSDIDKRLYSFGNSRSKSLSVSSLLFFIGWACETLESMIIFSALGVSFSFMQVAAFDSLISLLRSFAFVIPAGLGVMDLGYVSVLKGAMIPEAMTIGGAFIMMKRLREVVWIALGYVLLAYVHWSQRIVVRAVEPAIGDVA